MKMNWRKAGMPARRLLASPRGRAVMEEQRRGGGGGVGGGRLLSLCFCNKQHVVSFQC